MRIRFRRFHDKPQKGKLKKKNAIKEMWKNTDRNTNRHGFRGRGADL
ncbi:MAG: hypothetical protein ACW99E_19235 [Promethearchaeota archaeon]|jgi:hypothetical protein